MQRIVAGAVKGGFYGLVSGLLLGAAGNFVAPPLDYVNMLTWDNRYGKRARFTNLPSASILVEDLATIHSARHHNKEAYNEAFRNIQSVVTLYHRVKTVGEKNDMMLPTSMTNYTIRASKAMEAIYRATLGADAAMAADVERAMMNIQLSIEDFINVAREASKNALPQL